MTIQELILVYTHFRSTSDINDTETARLNIVEELASHYTLEICEFLEAVVKDEGDSDIVRIECLKHLTYLGKKDQEYHQRATSGLLFALHQTSEPLLAYHAANQCFLYLDDRTVFQALEKLLLDTNQDSILRNNLFGSLCSGGPNGYKLAVLGKLGSRDESFRPRIRRALDLWSRSGAYNHHKKL